MICTDEEESTIMLTCVLPSQALHCTSSTVATCFTLNEMQCKYLEYENCLNMKIDVD